MLNDIFSILLPQICLAGFVIINLLLSMILSPRYYKYARFVSLVGISLSIALLSTVQTEPQYFAFQNSIMSDSYTLLFDFVILLCGFFVVLLSKNLVKAQKRNAFTFQAILLTALLGAVNVVSANDFITLFVSLELLGFASYFLIGTAKGYYSKEASFKYLITSAVSSGVFLFGASYLYGITGSLNLTAIYGTVIEQSPTMIYTMASAMIVLGLISKLGIFPFANWVIDVYKGTETSMLAFLSTIPKLAVFGIICRLRVFPLQYSEELAVILAVICLITALWANSYAIREKNVKVILACSASANASYVLFAASLVSVYNLSAVIFYLLCYVLMNICAFAFLNIYGDKNSMNVEDFKGIFHSNHGLVGAYTVSILALAGIPITSGFISKIYLFATIASSGMFFIPFLILLLLLMVLALFYYLKILLPLFDEYDKNIPVINLNPAFSQKFVLVITAILTVLIGIYPEKLIELCRFIAYNI